METRTAHAPVPFRMKPKRKIEEQGGASTTDREGNESVAELSAIAGNDSTGRVRVAKKNKGKASKSKEVRTYPYHGSGRG